MAFGLFGGLLVRLFSGLTFGFWEETDLDLAAGLFSGLVLGLFFGLAAALVRELFRGFSGEQPAEHLMLSPKEGIYTSLKSGLFVGLLCGLAFGLAFALAFGRVLGLFGMLDFGLALRLFFGLFCGLLLGLAASVQHYILRFWLTRSGVFPWRAVPFLEDATARILLRRVGRGYSFAHRLLLDYFADAYTETTPVASPTPSSSP